MQSAVNISKVVEFGRQWTGQTVDGRFPLQQYLGGSDTSAVFLTHAPASPNSKAVIKLVLASAVDAEALLANWKRAAQLSHPNLMPVLDGGRTSLAGQQLLFVVTEFAEENLAQVIPQRALTVQEADAMVRPTIAVLSYLHGLGLVHGHIRPSNVMAVGDQLKLSSDGIRPAGEAPQKSHASKYDAPEVASGRSSIAADIWSFGAMLVESLTRQMPRIGNHPELPQPYAELVRHCLLSDPARRSTADEIAAAIHLQLESPRTERPPETTAKTQPAKAREAPVATASESRFSRPAAVAAMLVVFAVLAILFAWRLLHHESAPPANSGAAVSETATPSQQAPAREAGPGHAPAPTAPQSAAASRSSEVIHRVIPNASSGALNTIQGHVKVRMRLNVDAAGNVSDARFISAGPSKYFSRIAMEAAREWKFAPAASASETDLLFEFSRVGVEAFPQPGKESR